ncbi:MAG: 2-succinyl-5-enolpyruvyl-6-hydroxy-3-cyclohexene-1-carboxylic-acid synthase [Myxococcota bacterium]|nr:2-succinyl-5-enolpyruvyl-6-hydroxy-3-cyclohexene-1-carboxylic-acid synthase [Myxococcota bacterium]
MNTEWGNLIVEELTRLGVRDFCIAPGSRSTPITAAIARHPKANAHVFVDERSASFFALGIGKYTQKPAVVVTTSGTAISHAHPAVIEADALHIPLLLLSADRPPELRTSGANQTIDQVKLFGDKVRFFFDLPCPNESMDTANLLSLIDQAYAHSLDGPVHINCMFRKPLDPTDVPSVHPNHDEKPFCSIYKGRLTKDIKIPPHEKAVLLIGEIQDQTDQQHAKNIALESQCPVFCDASSGIRLQAIPNQLYPIDELLKNQDFLRNLKPDLIVHLGGSFVSKELDRWSNEQHCTYLHIRPDPRRKSTRVTTRYITNIPRSLPTLSHNVSFQPLLPAIQNRIRTLLEEELSEPQTIRIICQRLPDTATLFLSNSMPIRDFNRFVIPNKKTIRNAVNRGASGIDGVLATAAGWTHASQKIGVAILGDLASWHDLGTFLQLAESNIPLFVCIINNGGGGIFSFLPISKQEDMFEQLFATAHKKSFLPMLSSMGVPCQQINALEKLQEALDSFFQNPQFSIVEIFTDRKENLLLHRSLSAALQETISQQLS